MNFLSMPKKYYETETKGIHKVGYTLALAMMFTGVLETAHSIPYTLKGESDLTGKILGPMGVIAGGYMAYLYLREANLVGGY